MGLNPSAIATGALSFTVALAWNNAVSRTIESIFPAPDPRAAARVTVLYALAVTLLVVLIVAAVEYARRLAHLLGGPPAPPAPENPGSAVTLRLPKMKTPSAGIHQPVHLHWHD